MRLYCRLCEGKFDALNHLVVAETRPDLEDAIRAHAKATPFKFADKPPQLSLTGSEWFVWLATPPVITPPPPGTEAA